MISEKEPNRGARPARCCQRRSRRWHSGARRPTGWSVLLVRSSARGAPKQQPRRLRSPFLRLNCSRSSVKSLVLPGNRRDVRGSDGVEEIQQLLPLNREEEEKAVTRRSGLAIVGADSCVHRRCASVVKIRGTGTQTPQWRGSHFLLIGGPLRHAVAE